MSELEAKLGTYRIMSKMKNIEGGMGVGKERRNEKDRETERNRHTHIQKDVCV